MDRMALRLLLTLLLLSLPVRAWAYDYTADANAQLIWLMDVDEDPITDSSGNSKTGAGTNSPVFIASAQFDGGYQVDETDDYFTSPSGVVSGAGSLSHGCWMRSGQTGDNRHIMNVGDAVTNKMSFIIMDSGGTIQFGYWGSAVTANNAGHNDDAWHHIVVTYDLSDTASEYSCYIDAVKDLNGINYSSLDLIDQGVVVGAYEGDPTNSTYNYIGDLDEVFIFDDALTSTEISDIKDNGLYTEDEITHVDRGKDYTEDTNCQLAYLFTEGTGTTVADSSQNTNTGTFKGAGEPNWEVMAGVDAPSYMDYMVDFDGTDDRITEAYVNLTNNFSYVLWFASDSTGQSNKYIYDGGNSDIGTILYEYVDDKIEFFSQSSGSDPRPSSQIAITDTNWHHICYYYDGTAWKYALDGSSTTINANITFAISTVGTAALGYAVGFESAAVNCKMGEFAIFNDALTLVEINDIMDNGLVQPPTGTWIYNTTLYNAKLN